MYCACAPQQKLGNQIGVLTSIIIPCSWFTQLLYFSYFIVVIYLFYFILCYAISYYFILVILYVLFYLILFCFCLVLFYLTISIYILSSYVIVIIKLQPARQRFRQIVQAKFELGIGYYLIIYLFFDQKVPIAQPWEGERTYGK